MPTLQHYTLDLFRLIKQKFFFIILKAPGLAFCFKKIFPTVMLLLFFLCVKKSFNLIKCALTQTVKKVMLTFLVWFINVCIDGSRIGFVELFTILIKWDYLLFCGFMCLSLSLFRWKDATTDFGHNYSCWQMEVERWFGVFMSFYP